MHTTQRWDTHLLVVHVARQEIRDVRRNGKRCVQKRHTVVWLQRNIFKAKNWSTKISAWCDTEVGFCAL